MTRISCEVARDLLPLYCDDVCSQESRILIDEHLKNCSDCDALLKKMKMECSASTEQEMHDEEFVKAMASGWKKSVKNGFVKGVSHTHFVFMPGWRILGINTLDSYFCS